jgi:hypothetical protein
LLAYFWTEKINEEKAELTSFEAIVEFIPRHKDLFRRPEKINEEKAALLLEF